MFEFLTAGIFGGLGTALKIGSLFGLSAGLILGVLFLFFAPVFWMVIQFAWKWLRWVLFTRAGNISLVIAAGIFAAWIFWHQGRAAVYAEWNIANQKVEAAIKARDEQIHRNVAEEVAKKEAASQVIVAQLQKKVLDYENALHARPGSRNACDFKLPADDARRLQSIR